MCTPWWGTGDAPHVRWPGVTIEISAKWSAARGRWESPDGRYYFDAEAADRASDFFPTFLRHHKGEFGGQPFELLDYQRFIVRAVFGWKRASDSLRRFRKVFLAIPKGNGKTPLGVGVGFITLLCDNEPGAEVFSVAGDKEEAEVGFQVAKVMVEGNEHLKAMCEAYTTAITVPATNSTWKKLSSAPKHGFSVHTLLFDEFHTQADRDLFEALQRGMVKRRQPLLFITTTAGDDDESICMEEWEYARKVQSGTVEDETYLPVIFELAKDDDWKDLANLRRVNPGWGVTVKAEALESECKAAQAEPRKLNDFLRYHCNRWVNSTLAWIPVDWWDACTGTPAWHPGLRVAAGLDMAQKIDLAAFSVLAQLPLADSEKPEEVEVAVEDDAGKVQLVKLALNFRIAIFPHFWIPEATMHEREREDRVPYSLWAKEGLVTPTPGDLIDGDRIVDDIVKKIAPKYGLKGQRIGYDPAFATQLALALGAKGFQMVEVLQNYKQINEPAQAFYGLVKARRVLHGGNRVLRNHVENAAIKQDLAGRIHPVKPKRRAKRIDGVVASIMALDQLIRQPAPVASRYDTKGLRFL